MPIRVVDGLADALPAGDAEFDSAVAALVPCSVPNERNVFAEIRRVLRPGGQLCFFEDVAVVHPGPLHRTQRILDATMWRRLFAGSRTGRDTVPVEVAVFQLHPGGRRTFSPLRRLASTHRIGGPDHQCLVGHAARLQFFDVPPVGFEPTLCGF
ncbi:MAG TPA: methyltransferase domain-containing protein [Pilimelia sp.]|nr:methyltransferase domain-containing protein [Pilimelia sp.]